MGAITNKLHDFQLYLDCSATLGGLGCSGSSRGVTDSCLYFESKREAMTFDRVDKI